MSRILAVIGCYVCFTLGLIRAEAVDYPAPVGYVNDFAQVMPQEDEERLSGLIKELKDKTTAEIVVVIVETTQPLAIEDYAVGLFEKWGIGSKDKDNGLLVLVAIQDRRIHLEVGYGLEGVLPDGRCGEIINSYILPSFKKGELSQGIVSGVVISAGLIAQEYGKSLASLNGLAYTRERRAAKGDSPFLQSLLVFLLLPFLLIARLFLSPFTLLSSGRYRVGGLGMGSFGGFGGGFGGFGGGLSGGGGASGGW